uniref:Major facilitator superfamily (MFS) profile domain-containing protein n=1 Tax=Araucaria cunninghamii TaxID=56994 RepID=A0A0D6R3G3_ARACU
MTNQTEMEEVSCRESRRVPPGVKVIERVRSKCGSRKPSRSTYQLSVLVLTFVAYASYHASRKPSSIVKSVLDPDNSESSKLSVFSTITAKGGFQGRRPSGSPKYLRERGGNGNGWAPFNGKGGTAVLGEMDVAFLAVYSMGMYVAGHVGDRLDLRMFLTFGMMGSGVCVALFGAGYWWNIHHFSFYLVVQMIAGLFQATGWPSVVAVVGNWVGKKKRGLIMGIWNAHTSVGNICGSLIAASVLRYGWGWSFLLPGALVALVGAFVFLFLVVCPEDVGFYSSDEDKNESEYVGDEEDGVGSQESPQKLVVGVKDEQSVEIPLLHKSSQACTPIGFIEAWRIPGVAPFALCLFFSKLVAYTFLYWLPFYISHTAIAGEYLSDETAGNLSTLFDVGGVVGGILAGHISDRLNARAITAASFMYCSIPVLIVYRIYGNVSLRVNIGLMMLAGMFVNGPYALITTAVATDLGTHSSLKGNSRALATVTAIIDGTGSVGAALGPLLTGFISSHGWNTVFSMLMLAAFIAGLLLTRLVVAEIADKIHKGRSASKSSEGV